MVKNVYYVKPRSVSRFKVLFLGIALLIGCSKGAEDKIGATIEGYDLRLCACCGGLLVKPDDQPGSTFQWYQKNGNFNVTFEDKFPLRVWIRYHHLAQSCVASDGEIEITELSK